MPPMLMSGGEINGSGYVYAYKMAENAMDCHEADVLANAVPCRTDRMLSLGFRRATLVSYGDMAHCRGGSRIFISAK